jgi:hypothetical protein
MSLTTSRTAGLFAAKARSSAPQNVTLPYRFITDQIHLLDYIAQGNDHSYNGVYS